MGNKELNENEFNIQLFKQDMISSKGDHKTVIGSLRPFTRKDVTHDNSDFNSFYNEDVGLNI